MLAFASAGVLIGVGIGVVIGALLIWYLLRRQAARARPERLVASNVEAAKRASPQGLHVGDVVNLEGKELVVEGTLRYSQGSFTWAEHLLVDGDAKRWLSVEDDEGIELVVWQKGVDPDISPGEKRIERDGSTYELEEQGHAKYIAEGTTGTPSTGDVEYIDYEAGELRLSFERYGQDSPWELSSGRVIKEGALDIYPAGGVQSP